MNEQPKSESREANDKEVLSELYRKKKEIGRAMFAREKEQYVAILNKYLDVFDHVTQEVISGAKREDLSSALQELLDESELETYRTQLEGMNEKIAAAEALLPDVDADRDMHILHLESQYLADDSPFRPREEWFIPAIESIEKILEISEKS